MNDVFSFKLKPAKGVMVRQESFGAMVAGGNLPILNLNEDALSIWNLCDGTRTVKEIKEILTEEFEDSNMDQLLVEFVNYCVENGFLECQ